jgi:hypothetical protein
MEHPEQKDIPGFEGKYQATQDGRIYSLKNKIFLKQYDDTYGYNTCNLGGHTYKIHKLIGMTFLDNSNNHIQIDHINRNRKDNRVSNLRYVSSSENQSNKTSYARRDPALKNIQVKKSTFKVTINTKDKPTIHKSYKTLVEAQEFRDKILTEKKTQEQPVAPYFFHHH